MKLTHLLGVFAPLACASLVLADPTPDSGAQVYQNLVRSSVWIHSNRGSSLATGSGSVIDLRRNLVLTNYHVVGEIETATIFFPVFRDGRPIAEREYYLQRLRELGVRGKVIARDRTRDLAVIRLDKLPSGCKSLPLAEKSVTPGQTVHSIGNPGGSGALWVYTPGKVRQVYFKRWKALLEEREAQFEAEVVETDSATNSGDSGGPLVNGQGQLVAVTQGGALKASLLSTFIDISEVKKFLTAPEIRRLVPSPTLASRRTTALTSRDEAKFFSQASLDAANAAAKSIYAKNQRDLLIETFATVPDGKADAVKAMKGDEKQRFFRDWAEKREQEQDIHGIYLLVCREPSYLLVHLSKDPALNLHNEAAKKLNDAIFPKFKDKEFDEGLDAFVKSATELLSR